MHLVSRTHSQRRQPGARSGAISRVVITKIDTTAAMSRGPDGSTNKTFTTAVQQGQERTGLPKVASKHFGTLFLAHTHVNKRIENRIRILHRCANMRTAKQMLNWAQGNMLSPQDSMIGSYIGQTLQRLQERMRDATNSVGQEQ